MKTFVKIVVVLVVGALGFMLLYQIPDSGRRPALRGQCKNNLKQLGLALFNYHDNYGSFPPAYLVDENGRPAHSWRVLLLPYLGAKAVYDQYRFDEPWNGPHNSKLADKMPAGYRCPSFAKYHHDHNLETEQLKHLTNYVAITGDDAIFNGNHPTTVRDIKDGTPNTILVAEVRHHLVHWMEPDDVTENEFLYDLQSAINPDQANHTGGLQFLMAEGSVRLISSKIDVKLFHALVTRNGGEKIGEF